MKRQIKSHFLELLAFFSFITCVSVAQTPSRSEAISINGLKYGFKWDVPQRKLLYYRDKKNDYDTTALGDVHSAVNVLLKRDFPTAETASIWDLASGPDGEIVASVSIQFPPSHQGRLYLLTYGRDGSLKKAWLTNQYHHHKIAVDKMGNVYAFGERIDAMSTDAPLMVKYSPDGAVLAEFLQSSTIRTGQFAVTTSAASGEHSLFISGDELVLYIATTRDLFRFNLQGKILSHESLAPAMEKWAHMNHVDRAEIYRLVPDGKRGLVAQLRLWPSSRSSSPISFLTICGDNTLERITASEKYDGYPGQLLDVTDARELMYLQRASKSVEITYYPESAMDKFGPSPQ